MGTAGESEKFGSLYESYFSAVCAFFRRQGVEPDTARDLAQDTFLRMYQSFDQYRGEARWAYIQTLARRVLSNHFRDQQAAKRSGTILSIDAGLVEVESLATGEDLHAEYVSREMAVRLRTALAQLPDGMRTVATLFLAGESYEEISAQAGMTPQAVKSRLRDARRLLRERLGDDGLVDGTEEL